VRACVRASGDGRAFSCFPLFWFSVFLCFVFVLVCVCVCVCVRGRGRSAGYVENQFFFLPRILLMRFFFFCCGLRGSIHATISFCSCVSSGFALL
jgi:hypothetical protein